MTRRPESLVEQTYPNIARWVIAHGWVEIGQDHMGRSFVRALDEGGLVWEGETTYPTLDAALHALDTGLGAWIREQFGLPAELSG